MSLQWGRNFFVTEIANAELEDIMLIIASMGP